MTYSEGRGPAYINPFNCSICQNRIGNMIAHSQEDVKEIYDLLLAKQTGMTCLSCSQKYSLKEGFNEDQDELK
jgi:redox-regulated HSP33 family molecular chaperone